MKKLLFFVMAIVVSMVAFSQESVDPADLQFADELVGKEVVVGGAYLLADATSIGYHRHKLSDLYLLRVFDEHQKQVSESFAPTNGSVANVVTTRAIAQKWLRFCSDTTFPI